MDRIIKKSGDWDNKVNSVIEKTESNITYAESILEKDANKVLGSYSKEEQDIVQVKQPSCSPNVFEEVCLASNLPIFRFGHNFIVDASIRNILISNFEGPMMRVIYLLAIKLLQSISVNTLYHSKRPIVTYYCSQSFSRCFI